MARQFYCAKCGINLHVTRKALKNKMLILDLVEPHECRDGHAHNLQDAEKPIDKRFVFNDSAPSKEELDQQVKLTNLDYTDRRDPKFRRQDSSAPPGILRTVKGGEKDD